MVYKEINPNFWVYKNEDDFIEGVVADIQDGVGENESMLYSIETPEGISNVWGSAILDQRMAFVRKGDKVKITYKGLGVSKNKGRNPPKLFKVEIDKD